MSVPSKEVRLVARKLATAGHDWAAVILLDAIDELEKDRDALVALRTARPIDECDECVPALWWKFPITEPPYSGTPLDDDFPDYVTHWTPICPPTEAA